MTKSPLEAFDEKFPRLWVEHPAQYVSCEQEVKSFLTEAIAAAKQEAVEYRGKCSFCLKEKDCRTDGHGMWLCLPCGNIQDDRVESAKEEKV